MTALAELRIEDVEGLNSRAVRKLRAMGHEYLGDISEVEFHQLYGEIGFDQSKKLLKAFMKAGGTAKFSRPDWSEEDWAEFVHGLVKDEIVTWNEIASMRCLRPIDFSGSSVPPQRPVSF